MPDLSLPALDSPIIPTSWIVTGLSLTGLVVAALLFWTGLTVAAQTGGLTTVLLPLLIAVVVWFQIRKPTTLLQRQWRDFLGHLLVFLIICLLGVLASYSAAAETTGYADPALAQIDKALHFDWISWYREVSKYPVLQYVGSAAYACIYLSPVVLIAHFARAQRVCDARRFLLTFWFGALLTILLFPLAPAEGPLAFLWRGPIPYMPTSALYQEQLIPALRAHRMHHIDLGALRGLVCAPSFHTVSAVIYMAAAWPIRRLRWFLLPVNFAMLLATPIEGTHYLADMIAGSLVAVFAIVTVRAGLNALQQLGYGGA
jgi:hypothetical protein